MTQLAAVATGEFTTPIICEMQDPDMDLGVNDFCVIRTPKGVEATGYVETFSAFCEKQIQHRQVGRILRKASPEEVRTWHFLKRREKEAVQKCKEYVVKHKLDMKISGVTFDENEHKIIFNFTADDRVDFRDLVKDLAAEFHSRIELWQIGVRDEARDIGGLGCCGLTMCCATWMSKFIPVSIRYAKAQDIQFSPSKLSGACGRLRCCLAYEQKQYVDMGKNVPPIGSRVESKEFGVARVVERNLLSGTLTLATEEKHFSINTNNVDCKRIRATEDNAERGWTKGQKIWLIEPLDENAAAEPARPAEQRDETPQKELRESRYQERRGRARVQENTPQASQAPEPSVQEDSRPTTAPQAQEDPSEPKPRDKSRRGRRRKPKSAEPESGAKPAENTATPSEQNTKRRSRRGGRRRKRDGGPDGKDKPKD